MPFASYRAITSQLFHDSIASIFTMPSTPSNQKAIRKMQRCIDGVANTRTTLGNMQSLEQASLEASRYLENLYDVKEKHKRLAMKMCFDARFHSVVTPPPQEENDGVEMEEEQQEEAHRRKQDDFFIALTLSDMPFVIAKRTVCSDIYRTRKDHMIRNLERRRRHIMDLEQEERATASGSNGHQNNDRSNKKFIRALQLLNNSKLDFSHGESTHLDSNLDDSSHVGSEMVAVQRMDKRKSFMDAVDQMLEDSDEEVDQSVPAMGTRTVIC